MAFLLNTHHSHYYANYGNNVWTLQKFRVSHGSALGCNIDSFYEAYKTKDAEKIIKAWNNDPASKDYNYQYSLNKPD